MPVYEIEINGQSFEMEAPSADVAAAYARRIGSAVSPDAFRRQGGAYLDPDRTAPPQMMPPPQSDLSYRAGRAGDLMDNTIRSLVSGIPIVGGLTEHAAGPTERYGRFQAEHPVMSGVLPVAGAVASMIPLTAAAPAAFGLSQATLPARMAAGAGTGAAIGAGDAATRGTDIRRGAGFGVLAGGAGPAIGAGVGRVAGNIAARRAAPTLQQLEARAHALYDAADNAGVVVNQPALQRLGNDLDTVARTVGYNARLHPGIRGALEEAADQAGRGQMTLRQLDQFRRVVASAGKDLTNADQGRIAGELVDAVDDFLRTMGPGDIIAGNQQAGVAALTEARATWSQLRKGEIIEHVIDNARLSPQTQSWTLALRTQFRALARNPRRMAQFNPEEQAAIRRVVRGDPIESVLDIIGKFSPRTLHGAVMGGASGATMGMAAGGAAGGTVGAALAPIIGEAGRAIGGTMTRNNAAIASAMARSGPAYGQTATRVGGQRGTQAARIAQQLLIPTVPRAASEWWPESE